MEKGDQGAEASSLEGMTLEARRALGVTCSLNQGGSDEITEFIHVLGLADLFSGPIRFCSQGLRTLSAILGVVAEW